MKIRIYAIVLALLCLGVNYSRAEILPPISTCSPVGFQYDYLTLGRHIAVLCTKPLGNGVYVDGLSCSHSTCSPSAFGMSVLKVIAATSPRTEAQSQWVGNVKWTCDAPPDQAAKDLCAERFKWVSDNWATWTTGFKAVVWSVKANGTYTSRPAFALVNGVLGTKEVTRATVGALCDVSKPSAPATNGDIRAEFGITGVVTLCSKVP
jgi:hypothetical protein